MNKNQSIFMIVTCICVLYLSFSHQNLQRKVEKMEDQIKQIEDSINSNKDGEKDEQATI